VRWVLKSQEHPAVDALVGALRVPRLVGLLLAQRGITTPEAAHHFLNPNQSQLLDPFSMLGMKAAVERLEQAIAQKENTLIYGDYDVDGTTAVVILKTCIELLGGTADFHVPHRIREGYGMRDDVIERAAAGGVTLVISVDTGIRAFEAAETAKRLGLDLIVTDHHLPERAGVPAAVAVLNPNQEGCGYACKALCGAGVAFKLAQALLTRAGRQSLIPSFLKMVAIATIADAVPLTGENRVIAKLGLDGLRRPVNGGLKALMQVAQMEGRTVTTTDVGFRLAPRINAAGRMDIARDVVELFTSRDERLQHDLAAKLNQLNSDRQAEEQRILAEQLQRLETDTSLRDAYCLVLEGEGWHRGVIGITATRVVERTGKPTLIVSCDTASGEAHGSGRSIPTFHLLNALESEACRPLFTRFGGHAHACGFTLPMERVPQLRAAMDAYAKQHLTLTDLEPQLAADAELKLDEVTQEFFTALSAMEPFGMENREPVFVAREVRLLQPPRLMKEKHIKLRIGQNGVGPMRPQSALGWRMAERLASEPLLLGEVMDVAFRLEENTHPDFGGLQLILQDFRKTAAAAAGHVSADPAVAQAP
jgi:single-stranded-DNA-specific exonuclease